MQVVISSIYFQYYYFNIENTNSLDKVRIDQMSLANS